MRSDELIRRARAEYGDLIERVLVWPDGGVDAILIGGSRAMCLPSGHRYVVDPDGVVARPSFATRTRRLIAQLRGQLRTRRNGDS